jgi:hypothetical protein
VMQRTVEAPEQVGERGNATGNTPPRRGVIKAGGQRPANVNRWPCYCPAPVTGRGRFPSTLKGGPMDDLTFLDSLPSWPGPEPVPTVARPANRLPEYHTAAARRRLVSLYGPPNAAPDEWETTVESTAAVFRTRRVLFVDDRDGEPVAFWSPRPNSFPC